MRGLNLRRPERVWLSAARRLCVAERELRALVGQSALRSEYYAPRLTEFAPLAEKKPGHPLALRLGLTDTEATCRTQYFFIHQWGTES